jgi:hypothetical protein
MYGYNLEFYPLRVVYKGGMLSYLSFVLIVLVCIGLFVRNAVALAE